jgi:competence protein ComEC
MKTPRCFIVHWKTAALALLLLALISPELALCDYLVVERAARLKAEPRGDGHILSRPQIGSRLELLEDSKTNGYYFAREPSSGKEGYIYKTLVQRYIGSINDDLSLNGQTYATVELNAAFFDYSEPYVYFHFIDVGQGDATLIEFPCGVILIDAGYGNPDKKNNLVNYLKMFFAERPSRTNSIDAVFLTHDHSDHTSRIRETLGNFNVRRYFDNGEQPKTKYQFKARARITRDNLSTKVRAIWDDDVVAAGSGLTDAEIDPFAYPDCDLDVLVLSGGFTKDSPNWTEVLDNPNNRSLVVRIDFGETSALFTGDLEEGAIEILTDFYAGTDILDIDLYQAGHHGAKNGTTTELVNSMTPEVAVFSMSRHNYKGSKSAWKYGHPHEDAIGMLLSGISDLRSPAVRRKIGRGGKDLYWSTIEKRLYGTGWDGTVVVRGDLQGNLEVAVESPN